MKFLLIALLALTPAFSATVTLPVSVRKQEKGNWNWAAISEMVLVYHGFYRCQSELAAWAAPGYNDASIPLHSANGGMDVIQVLQHFGNLSTQYMDSVLSFDAIVNAIDAGKPIIAKNGSGAYLIYGYSNTSGSQNIIYVSTWSGQGNIVSDYSDFLYMGPWQETAIVNTTRGTIPSRPFIESEIPTDYALYAFDQLFMNDGVICYQDPSTTTDYCAVASDWSASRVNTSGTYGVTFGVTATTGSITSGGPVWLRDRSTVTDDVTMSDTSTLTIQSQVTIGGQVVPQTVPWKQFGWGPIDFTGIPSLTISIEPDQPITHLSPGKYWALSIKQRSPVVLSSGDYYFNNLYCDGCTLQIDPSNGPVRVFVAKGIKWTGTLSYLFGGPDQFLLAYLGSVAFYVNGPLDGTVISPTAQLVIGQASHQFEGMYIGKSLAVHQYTTVRFNPFSF